MFRHPDFFPLYFCVFAYWLQTTAGGSGKIDPERLDEALRLMLGDENAALLATHRARVFLIAMGRKPNF